MIYSAPFLIIGRMFYLNAQIKHMKYRIFFLTILMPFTQLFGQGGYQALTEGEPLLVQGVELSYRLEDESTREAGKDTFSRYRIRVVATNSSDCSRVYRLGSGSTTIYSPERAIARFVVRNANGKRLTAKEASIKAGEWWVTVKVEEKNSEGKTVYRNREMMAGYIFREGDTREASATVLVPLGEKPEVEVILLPKDRF